MAGGEPVDANGYRLTAPPLSRWRRFTRDFLPYWQASSPKFVLTVTRLGPAAESQALNWFTKFATGDYSKEEVVIPPLETGQSVKFEVGGHFLGFTGDTLIAFPSDLASERPRPYRTLYAFHTTPKTWVFLTFVVAVLAGVVATLGQWLLSMVCQ